MDKQNADRLLYFLKEKVEASEEKWVRIIHSEQRLDFEELFSFKGCDIKLKPLLSDSRYANKVTDQYVASFICEILVNKAVVANSDGMEQLSVIMTWLEFDYVVGSLIENWRKFDAEWVEIPTMNGTGYSLGSHKSLPKESIHEIIRSYETVQQMDTKRSKKIINIKNFLNEGLKLKSISMSYCFLSFYKVIETVSDDFLSKKCIETEDEIINELMNYQLTDKASQKIKIFYLLRAFENDFDLKGVMKLAQLRNNISHSVSNAKWEDLKLCQEVAFWAGELFLNSFEGCNER